MKKIKSSSTKNLKIKSKTKVAKAIKKNSPNNHLGETKELILNTARILFGKNGFESTSIRDIALKAKVNVAAINYHFKSKDHLYHLVLESIFIDLDTKIEKYFESHPKLKVADFVIWIFYHFVGEANDLRATFKMFLDGNVISEVENMTCSDRMFGPPGGKVIALSINQELNKKLDEANLFWAVKMIFSNVIHLALMHTNYFCKLDVVKFPHHDINILEKDIRRLVKVILNDL